MNLPAPSLYGTQLEARAAELLGDLDTGERLSLLGVMDPDDMRASLAWLVSYAPKVFDFTLVRDRALVGRLQERLDDLRTGAYGQLDGLDPYCATCGALAGIFIGHGDGWHHYRGEGTTACPVKLYDAGHAVEVAWGEAGSR